MNEKEIHELNLFCAESVMGWKRVSMGQVEKEGNFAVQGQEIYIHDRSNYVKNFHPTTDPAAAMTVLETCIVKLGWSRIIGFGSTSDGNYFINHFDPEPGSEAFCTTYAETLPLAICLFAKTFEKCAGPKPN